jgi:hypothetical protein
MKILNDLVKNIKSKFSKNSDEEYDESEFDENTELTNVGTEEFDLEDDEDDGKKKKSKVIQIVIGVAVVGLLASEFLMEEEPEQLPVVKTKRKKKKPNKKAPVAKKDTKQEPAAVADTPEPKKKVEPKPSNTQDPAPEPDSVQLDPEPVEVAKPTIEPKNEPETPTQVEVPNELSLGEGKPDETIVENRDTAINDIIDQLADDSEEGGKIEQKLEENKKLEYTKPPTYLDAGRGLVYNCKGKHWACVNKESYIACRNNEKWSQQNEKGPECSVADVYASDTDCRIVQVDNVNKLIKPDCK